MGDAPISEPNLSLGELQERVAEFNRRRRWPEVHSVRSLSEAIVVESAELLELSLWGADARDRPTDLQDELADLEIYIISLANYLDVDLGDAVLKKLSANEVRFPQP